MRGCLPPADRPAIVRVLKKLPAIVSLLALRKVVSGPGALETGVTPPTGATAPPRAPPMALAMIEAVAPAAAGATCAVTSVFEAAASSSTRSRGPHQYHAAVRVRPPLYSRGASERFRNTSTPYTQSMGNGAPPPSPNTHAYRHSHLPAHRRPPTRNTARGRAELH